MRLYYPSPIPEEINARAAETEIDDRRGMASLEKEFVGTWNSTDGVVAYRGDVLTPAMRIAFRELIANPDWQWRVALAKFPLKWFSDGRWKPGLD